MKAPKRHNVLYVFGAEKAQGAEIVIERLMAANHSVNAHLMLAAGDFADELLAANKPYQIHINPQLRKLNRGNVSGLAFLWKALKNQCLISSHVYHFIKREQINVVHANTVVSASYLLPLVRFAKVFLPHVKFVWSDHDISHYGKAEKFLSKLCNTTYNLTLCVSAAVARKYSTKKVFVLYNGLSIEVYKLQPVLFENFRSSLNLPKDACVIGMAANICEGKGQLALVRVFRKIKQKSPLFLVFAGSFGPEQQYNDDFMRTVETSPGIIYLGQYSEMVKFYNGCDIIVNNSNQSRSEALGTAIYEAMACEKIVVAAKTGGTPEIIADGVDGVLFEPDNETDLSQKLQQVWSTYHELAEMRLRARAKVLAKFDINQMVKEYNQMVNQLIR